MSPSLGAAAGTGRVLVRRHLVADLGRRADRLAFGREGPVVPLLGVVEVLGALDDAHRADLVARAFARRDDLHRCAVHRLRHRVMLERDADQRFARGRRTRRRRAALGVLVDVLVHGLHEVEGLVLAHQLHQRGQHRVRSARGVRVGHLHVVLVDGLGQVGPALGLGQLALGQLCRVVAVAERAGVDADGAELRRLGLPHRPVLQLGQRGRLVLERQALLGGLHVRVAGAAPPDVALGVGGLGLDLGVELARALARHQHLDAGGLLERGDHRPAPLLLHRAVQHQLALRGGRYSAGQQGQHRQTLFQQLHRRLLQGCCRGMPTTAEIASPRAWLVARIGLPSVSPLPSKKGLMRPPASVTSNRPAAQSQELMCSSQ